MKQSGVHVWLLIVIAAVVILVGAAGCFQTCNQGNATETSDVNIEVVGTGEL